jgi:ABC-2 type transport system permease protein
VTRAASVFLDLYLIQLASYRWAWHWQAIGGLIAPLAFMFMMTSLLDDDLAVVGAHILAGNLVLSVILTTMGNTASRFALLKETEGLDYYAVLPIHRSMLVGAVLLAFVTLALPGMLGTLVFGRFLFGIPLSPHPLALVVVILAALSLAVVGTIIGILAPNPETSNLWSNLVLFGLMFLSPVLIPIERLPTIIQVTSRLLPSSYAVEALKRLLVGTLDQTVALNVVALVGFSVVALYLVSSRLDWRRR